jgi:superfamily II DNA or RNA helicase
MTDLRPYQSDIVETFNRTVESGKRRVILVAPTGAGKTVIGGEIVRRYTEAGKRVLFMAHRREIISQTSDKLMAVNIPHGILQAGFATELDAPVQVASVATLTVRAIRSNKIQLPPADLLVVDECHHATAQTYKKIIAAYPDAVLLGLTATPCRGDGRGLGAVFETLVECPQVAALIEQKYLVGTKVFAPSQPDLAGVTVRQGDWAENQLAERMDRPQLVGDIVTHWQRHAEGRRTVVFATGVGHSIHIRDEFRRAGVSADHLDGSTPKDERDDVLLKLACGAIDIVCNAMILTEGWDLPELGCIVLARPTRRMGLFRQMVGRGLRPAKGKADCILIDHSGAVHRHGFPEDHVTWTLDPDKHADNPKHRQRTEGDFRSRLVDCKKCGALRTGGEPCKHCGWMPAPPPKHVATVDADLELQARSGRSVGTYYSPADRDRWHRQLAYIATERGYKNGWAAWKYKEKFGDWPAQRYVQPAQPNAEVLSWVRSRQIAFAKARQKEAAA